MFSLHTATVNLPHLPSPLQSAELVVDWARRGIAAWQVKTRAVPVAPGKPAVAPGETVAFGQVPLARAPSTASELALLAAAILPMEVTGVKPARAILPKIDLVWSI